MSMIESNPKLEDAWWKANGAGNGRLPADPADLYAYRLACYARATPQGLLRAVEALALAGIAAGEPCETPGVFSRQEWIAWAAEYGVYLEQAAPWE